jgi:hypothetical protein
VLTVQTSGEALNFHPPLHGCLTDGLFCSDGTFPPFQVIDEERLPERFCERVLAALRKRELISDDVVVAQILSLEHSGFVVWVGERFTAEDSKRFVARYIERGAVSLEKLSVAGETGLYTTKEAEVYEYDALEFLALLSTHIAKPYESITRYYGYWSCIGRGERRKREPVEVLVPAPPVPIPRSSSQRASCIKRVYELNPLECPWCKMTHSSWLPTKVISLLPQSKR